MGVDRVCLGGDFTTPALGGDAAAARAEGRPHAARPHAGPGIDGLVGSDDYPNLLAGLDRRGWSQADVDAVTHGNLLRFLRGAL